MVEEDKILEQRKEKVFEFFKQKQQWLYYLGLAIVTWFGAIFIRTANIDRLKDVTGGLTLAPDLDPYLFLRWAQEIVTNGSLPVIDMMRNVPLGYSTAGELPIVPYGIAYLYKFLSIFSSEVSVYYAAIIFPVLFFVLTLIAFFLLVRRIFRENKLSNLIALIATAILAVIPGFVHRTVAGVPEKESIGFLFLFLAFYWFVISMQEKNWKKAGIFGLLAGLATGLMGLAWGGVTFAFVVITLASLAYFFTDNFSRKDLLAYSGWIIGFSVLLLPHSRYGIGLFTSTTSGLAYFALGLFGLHYLLFETKLAEKIKLTSIKLPPKVLTLILISLLGLIAILLIKPDLITHIFQEINAQLIKPFEDSRFTITVAENNRPFFNSWKGSFGSFFWVFFLGSSFLFYEALSSLKNRNRFILTLSFFLLLSGIIFTRMRPDSLLNGSSPISISLFIGSILLFLVSAIYVYFKEEEIKIDPSFVLVLSLIFFTLISIRGAVRLLYFAYPTAALVGSFTIVRVSQKAFEYKDEVLRMIIVLLAISAILITGWSLYNYSITSYNEVKYGSVPSSYNVQWQQAMGWVRENTSEDAVFAHWWDYGYWVQTIGKRATILDGGNAIVYWNHLFGNLVLTGNNEIEALEFLKTHEATHLLIDSSDIGKYTAFSSIGSDENYDKYSFIPTFHLDNKATQERRNTTLYFLSGGVMLDEDIIWKNKIFRKGSAGIGAFILPLERIGNSVAGKLQQPKAIIIDKGEQIEVPINCVYLDGKIEFDEEGIDGCLFLLPRISGNGFERLGGGLWLSPRLMRSQFTKFYLFNETENFKLVHVEDHPIINQIRSQNEVNIPSLAIVQGRLLGPIKIWEINYPEGIKTNPEYLEKGYPEDRPGLWKV